MLRLAPVPSLPAGAAAPAWTLVCLPYAGGRASVFRDWPERLGHEVAVAGVDFPGRPGAKDGPPARRVEDLAPAVAEAIVATVHGPYALFGHSMGALVAFEAVRLLRLWSASLPQRVFVAAHRAPHLPRRGAALHDLPPAEFRRRLAELGGTSAAVLADPEMMAVLAPSLRADLELVETYSYRPADPLDVAFTGFAGAHDGSVEPREMAEWQSHTTRPFRLHVLTGDHFFIHTQAPELLAQLRAELQPSAAAVS
jgi:surfactin synthase thioesterase subunit